MGKLYLHIYRESWHLFIKIYKRKVITFVMTFPNIFKIKVKIHLKTLEKIGIEIVAYID